MHYVCVIHILLGQVNQSGYHTRMRYNFAFSRLILAFNTILNIEMESAENFTSFKPGLEQIAAILVGFLPACDVATRLSKHEKYRNMPSKPFQMAFHFIFQSKNEIYS